MAMSEIARSLLELERTLTRCLWLALVAGLLLVAATVSAAGAPYEQTAQRLSKALARSRALAGQRAEYDVVFRRDPMQPIIDAEGRLVSTVGLHGGLSVQGVIWSEKHPLAVVDDELLAVGDVVGPYTILEIRADGVIVQRHEQRLRIPLDRGFEPADAGPL